MQINDHNNKEDVHFYFSIMDYNLSLCIPTNISRGKNYCPCFLRRNEKVLNNRPSLTSNSRVKNLSSTKSKSFSLYHHGLSVNEMSAISSKYFKFSYIVCVPIMPEYLAREKEWTISLYLNVISINPLNYFIRVFFHYSFQVSFS